MKRIHPARLRMARQLGRHFCHCFLLPLLFWPGGRLQAQSIPPVRSHTTCHPPHPHSLPDWFLRHDDAFTLQIDLLDASVPTATLKLRMVLASDRLRLENSRPLPRTFNVRGGEPLILRSDELREYFNIQNLAFSGMTRQQYLQNGERLPDGFYQLSFEVYEAASGVKVSLYETPGTFRLISCEPPLLYSPADRSVLQKQGATHIVFGWTPRHAAQTSLMNTEYRLELKRIPEHFQGDWQSRFDELGTVYSQTTDQTSLVYNDALPPLEIGQRYAFRVQASGHDRNGQEIVFSNRGYSEIFCFTYKAYCPALTQWRVDSVTAFTARLHWPEDPLDAGYRLQYRKADVPDAAWFPTEIPLGETTHVLYPLEPATAYECTFQRRCEDGWSEPDRLQRFKTPDEKPVELKCGEHPTTTPPATDETDALPVLRKFDRVKTQSGFEAVIDEVEGYDGYFSGTAHTYVPLLDNTGIKLTFSRIFVNKAYELVSGTFKAVKSGRTL
ncbi:MAG: hypothetical protein K2O01_09125 [Bacteroidales bacterium]|nr:hypothetical protein [Bacteroidales bacterium]